MGTMEWVSVIRGGWDRKQRFSRKEVASRKTGRSGFPGEWSLFKRIVQSHCIYTDRCDGSLIKEAIYNKLVRAFMPSQ